jgi:hypothetical protein
MVRSASQTSATSTSGSGSGTSGSAIAAPSGSGGIPSAAGDYAVAMAADNAATLGTAGALELLGYAKLAAALLPAGPILVTVATAVLILFDIFDELFGGSDSPPIPRKLLHGRHPLYPNIIGVPVSLISDQASSGAPQFCGDLHVCPYRVLADDSVLEIPGATTPAAPTPRPTPTWDEIQHDIAALRFAGESSAEIERYLEDADGLPKSLAFPLSLPGAYVPHSYQAIPTPGPTTLEPTLPE